MFFCPEVALQLGINPTRKCWVLVVLLVRLQKWGLSSRKAALQGQPWVLLITGNTYIPAFLQLFASHSKRTQGSHVPVSAGQTPCAGPRMLQGPCWDAPDPSSQLHCPLFPQPPPGRHPGALWYPEPIFYFPSPHPCDHRKTGTL